MRKYSILAVSALLIGLLVGCNKELNEPEVKRYDTEIHKEIYDYTKSTGSLEDPVLNGEQFLVDGPMVKDTHEEINGSFSMGIKRVFRGEAAKYRVIDKISAQNLGDNEELIMLELEVSNFEPEEGLLYFTEKEIGLYSTGGERIPLEETLRKDTIAKTAVYAGEQKKITLAGIVPEGTEEVLVGLDKLLKEQEEETDIETEEKETEQGIEHTEEATGEKIEEEAGKKEEKEGKTTKTIYFSIAGIEPIEEFYEEKEN